MDDTKRQALAGLLIGLVPPDGSAIGNQSLREGFIEAARAVGHKNTGSALEVAFEPDVGLRKRKDGLYEIEVNDFDYFDTAKGELVSGGKAKIAMWLLDIDYDDRSLFPRQVFFPMAGKDEGWHKLKKDIRAELDEDLLEKFKGTVSLPFEAGDNKKVAVKIVDDRGIESVKVIPLH